MFSPDKAIYEFGPYRLEPSERLLLRIDRPVNVPPKAFETLLLLVRNSGHVLSKEELMRELWPDTYVEENNLTQQISQLRRALGVAGDGGNYIETVPRLGYRFAAPVREGTAFPKHEIRVQRRTRTRIVVEEQHEEASEETDSDPTGQYGELKEQSQGLISRRGAAARALRFALAVVAAGGLAGLLVYRPLGRREAAARSETLKMVKLTTDGRAQSAAISTDGRYVAYVSGDPGNQSLWVRQVATHSDLQVVAAHAATFAGVSFSHDNNFLFYSEYPSGAVLARAFRVPTVGGEPSEIARNMVTMLTVSPDDRRIAFVRATHGHELVLASSQGGEEKMLWRASEQSALANPAWSPDGKRIAAAVWSRSGETKTLGVWVFDVATSREEPLGRQNWTDVASLAWLADGKRLAMTASDLSSGPAGQIWELSYPGGELRRITNDLTDYGDVSATADSNMLATVATEVPSNVWVAPAAHPESGEQITSGSVGFGGWSGLAWTPDQRIVYYSVAGGNQELWMMDADGNHSRRITASAGWKLEPTTCANGGTVLYTVLSGASSTIWSVNEDGSNAKQQTFSGNDQGPACSADGKWVVFSGGDGRLRRVAIDGGTPVELSSFRAMLPAVSPDGKWIACIYFPETNKQAIAILPFEGGQPAKTIPFERGTLPVESANNLQWTPDGEALAYVEIRKGVSNIWVQPVNGSAPKPLTNFPNGQIFSFAWSRDGQQLALTRGTISSDVILISGFNR